MYNYPTKLRPNKNNVKTCHSRFNQYIFSQKSWMKPLSFCPQHFLFHYKRGIFREHRWKLQMRPFRRLLAKKNTK